MKVSKYFVIGFLIPICLGAIGLVGSAPLFLNIFKTEDSNGLNNLPILVLLMPFIIITLFIGQFGQVIGLENFISVDNIFVFVALSSLLLGIIGGFVGLLIEKFVKRSK